MNLKNIFKKVKNKLKDRKGLSSIELVTGTLISIVLFAGFLDYIIISNRMQAMATSMTYLTRVISNQGCLSNNPESNCGTGYKIDYIKNKKFITSQEIYNQIQRIMTNEQISSNEWKVYINGTRLRSTTRLGLFDFQQQIDIDIMVNYKWKNVDNFLPINLPTGQLLSNQKTISLYKSRTQDSSGGFDYGT